MNVGVVLVDASRRVVFASNLAIELVGCTSEAQLREQWPRLFGARGFASAASAVSAIRRNVDVPLPSGVRHLRLEAHPFASGGALVLFRDSEAGEPLEIELLLASRMRSLVHVHRVLAHDLKAPLNAMQLTLELLGDATGYAGMPDGESRRRRHLEVLREELVRLNRILETMLGHNEPLEWTPQIFDVREVIREVLVLLAPQARTQRVDFAIALPEAALWMSGYRDRVKQALLNIAINRLESMPDGGRLQIVLYGNETSAMMNIMDNGAPIPDAVIDEIGGMWVATKGSTGGTGLYVARLVVEGHGGDMSIESSRARGTRFTVRLSLRGNAAGVPLAAGAVA